MSDERTPIEDMKETLEDLREHDGETVKIYMPKDAYDRLTPEMIADREAAYHCKIVPVSDEEMKQIKDNAITYHAAPSMPKIPEIVMLDNPHRGKPGGNKTPRIEPKDYRKKKKAKRRAEKQARRRRN